MLKNRSQVDNPSIRCLQDVFNLAEDPEKFLMHGATHPDLQLRAINDLFTLLSRTDRVIMRASSKELVENFNLEQKWEQLKRQNTCLIQKFDYALKDMKFFKADPTPDESKPEGIRDNLSDDLSDQEELSDTFEAHDQAELSSDHNNSLKSDSVGSGEQSGEDESMEIQDVVNTQDHPTQNGPESEMDVDFFSREEMQRFTSMCEEKNVSDSDDSKILKVDEEYTSDSEAIDENDEDDGAQMYYRDFFCEENKTESQNKALEPVKSLKSAFKKGQSETSAPKPDTRRVRFSMDNNHNQQDEESCSSLEENQDDNCDLVTGKTLPKEYGNDLSSTELENLKLAKKISQLELQAVSDKPWMLRGEVKACDREPNSLLEHDIEVEVTAKRPPVITEEVTISLEDLIKDRIKTMNFDDPVRKAPPVLSSYNPNKAADVEEKFKKTLMDVYEEDYMKKVSHKNTEEKYKTSNELEVEEKHKEITLLYETINAELDILSNHHLTPRALQYEEFKLSTTTSTNLPSLIAEEITPSNIADASTLSHKEQLKPVRNILSDMDLTSQQKKRLRSRTKKRAGTKRAEKLKLYAAIKAAQPLRKETKKEVEMEKQKAAQQLSKVSNVKIIGKYNTSTKKNTKKRNKCVNSDEN